VRHSRRRFIGRAAAAAAGIATVGPRAFGQAPAIVTRDAARPAVAQGAAVGDVGAGRALVWSRTDRPARMVVEWATSDRFENARRVVGPNALETSDFAAKLDLRELPPGQRIHYRVRFQDLRDLASWSEPVLGSFRTPARHAADVTLAWSADTVGQGWGINPEWGGLRLYETMRREEPDLFVHTGDLVYADNVLQAEVKLEDGTLWKNVLTEPKSKLAETLDDFRGNYLYNYLDENLRRFNGSLSQVLLWDDHETRNDWWPTQVMQDPRYKEKSLALLSARARRAMLEMNPIRPHPDEAERIYRNYAWGESLEVFALDMRSYRGDNGPNRQTEIGPDAAILGAEQLAWLKAALAASRATWKVIAADMPIGLLVPFSISPDLPPCVFRDGPPSCEAIANGDGPPLGRELEIADLLSYMKRQRIRNVVWITGDVHYCAAHHYDPTRARFTDFDPFWELVAGPAHAGTFGPNSFDPTFGPEQRFIGIPPGMKPNRPPSAGFQFYGTLAVNARTRALTARLKDLAGKTLWSTEMPAV